MRTPEEIARGCVSIGKRNRKCSICEEIIAPGIKHISISKGGYGYWNICLNCMKIVEDELHKD
jgi:hypothetical protein